MSNSRLLFQRANTKNPTEHVAIVNIADIIIISLKVTYSLCAIFYPALVLFKQSNCINWITFCYIRSLTKM